MPHADARHLECGRVEQARCFIAGYRRLVHADRLHQRQAIGALFAYPLRCLPELFAEGTGERCMGGVAGTQRHLQDVACAVGQPLRGSGQAPSPQVAHHRGASAGLEQA
jgi:hypothetical protein